MTGERNCGLDLYRLLAMLMITVLHVNFFYLKLPYDARPSVYYTGWFAEAVCYCGANCFALLTGYLTSSGRMGYDKKWFQKLFDFWGKTVLFCVVLYFTLIQIFPGIKYEPELFKSFFYIRDLWYAGAYIGLFLFMPLLSGIISRFSVREQILFFVVTFFVFSFLYPLEYTSPFYCFSNGYSAIWLMVCFCWGQVLQTLAPRILQWKHHTAILIIGAVIGAVFPFLFFYGYSIPAIARAASHFSLHKNSFIDYLSPFCVLEAVCLLLLFSKIRIENPKVQKVIAFLSVYSFGIYLFQCHPVIWDEFIVQKNQVPMSAFQIVGRFAAVTLGLFAAGVLSYFLVSKFYQLIRFSKVGEFCYWLLEKLLFRSVPDNDCKK
ncbi:MAG: acyltransferase [Lentisphaeria bacterium]|nr:acyltransferase [Lentisphaeria bacterium]